MTTRLTSEHRQGVPTPHAYASHLANVDWLQQRDAEWRAERRRRRIMRRLVIAAFASVVFLAVVLYLRLK
jgi:DNA replication protein DnaC